MSEIQRQLYREELLRRHDQNRGAKYQPFSIEPSPWDRNRTAPEYSDADRALRRQWLQDQTLSAREPVKVPELETVNIFRKMWRKPWEVLFSSLRPVLVSFAYFIYFLVNFLSVPFPAFIFAVSTYKLYFLYNVLCIAKK